MRQHERVGMVGTMAAVIAIAMAMRGTSGAAAPPAGTCNLHFANTLTFEIPGRGLALSWAPAGSGVNGGHAIAVGGHLIGSQAYLEGGERYDTKLYDTTTGQYLKRFGAHYWWAVSNAWSINPFIGEVIADGAGDHAAKVFRATAPGTNLGALQNAGVRGRYAVEDGALPGIKAVYGKNAAGMDEINAWITSLDFSPDGAWLAGGSKDGTIRIWQITDRVHPDDQFKVVKVIFDKSFGPTMSVRWSPDGRVLAASSKDGNVSQYAFDPELNRWDASMIEAFRGVTFTHMLKWVVQQQTVLNAHGLPAVADVPVWTRGGLGPAWNVRWTPDGRYLAAAASRSSVVFDLVADAKYPLMGEGHGLDIRPDGRAIAIGGADGHVHVFTATDATPPFALLDRLQAHTEPVVGAVAWSPDGATLATVAGGPLLHGPDFNTSVEGDDDHVRLWVARESDGESCAKVTTTTTRTTTTSTSTSSTLAGATTTTVVGSTTTTTEPKGGGGGGGGGPLGAYPGFGLHTTGGAGHPTFVVTKSDDTGPGTLRDALAKAEKAGGGIVTFALGDGGDLHPGRNLVVPANTTIDATGSHVTLWGGNEGWSNGLLNVWNSNVIVVGLRFRNGLNDGIQIAPKSAHGDDVANVVVDRCTFTGNADGAIDVTGRHGHIVHDVTIMRNLIAGTGRYCSKGLCGGGSLFKYGATNGSYYGNWFFANLERDPLISGSGAAGPVVADLRYNLAEWTQSSSMSVRQGGTANVVGNYFFGPRDGALVWAGGQAYFGGGNANQKPDPRRELVTELPVPSLPEPTTLADALDAGALPRDPIDLCYLAIANPSYASFKAATCAAAIAPAPKGRGHRAARD